MEIELERKKFYKKNYTNKIDMENSVKEYIKETKEKHPDAIVTKEFYKGSNIIVRATKIILNEINQENYKKMHEEKMNINKNYIVREKGGFERERGER